MVEIAEQKHKGKKKSTGKFDISEDLNLDELYIVEENINYPVFDWQEAEIIAQAIEVSVDDTTFDEVEMPSEEVSLVVEKEEIGLHSIFDFIYAVGDGTVDAVKFFITKIIPIVLYPIVFTFSKVFSGAKRIVARLLASPKKTARNIKRTSREIKMLKAKAKAENGKRKAFAKALYKYLVRSFSRHRHFYNSIANIAFPALIFIIAFSIFSSQASDVYALEVLYGDKVVGYVENEKTFEEAVIKLDAMFANQSQEQKEGQEVTQPTYKITKVQPSKLSNSDMISESLIQSNSMDYFLACGIYVDGEFLCAVKNESDATSVFTSVLEPYKEKASSGTTVGFVEEITYSQGYYPNGTDLVWDTLTLKDKLSNPKTQSKTYTAKTGDTLQKISEYSKVAATTLQELNPNVNFTELEKGDVIYLQKETQYVRIKEMRTQTRTETIGYETIKKDSSTLFKGTEKVVQNGKNGYYTITELVTYIDGKVSYTSEISKKETVSAVDKIVYVGTKTVTSSSSGGNYGGTPTASGFIWPTYGAYNVSSEYGYRSASISGWSFHGGIDIIRYGGSTGIPIIAAKSGTVIVAQSWDRGGYGVYVKIDHGNGYQTLYGHMQPGSMCVSVGQYVSQGQQIGRIGGSGNVTGPHLHFEVLVYGKKVNPRGYIGYR